MANPQKEDGYTAIANEIVEHLWRVNLSPYESRVLWYLFRKTYGWQKKTDRIALSQFAKDIELDRRLIFRALKGLSSKEMIVIYKDDKNIIKYGFQKNYEKWRLSSKKMSVISRDDRLSSKEILVVSSKEIPTKESIKETIQKKTPLAKINNLELKRNEWLQGCFDKFWQTYPKKIAKEQAKKSWWKIKPNDELFLTILDAVQNQSKSDQWLKEKGRFIPHPATWLNQKRWEDNLNPIPPNNSPKTPKENPMSWIENALKEGWK